MFLFLRLRAEANDGVESLRQDGVTRTESIQKTRRKAVLISATRADRPMGPRPAESAH